MSAAAIDSCTGPLPATIVTAHCWLSGLEQEPPTGSHLATARERYTHHGVYVGGGAVIHYAGWSSAWIAGPVEEVSLLEFARGRKVWIIDHGDARYPGPSIAQRARARLGEREYHVLTNNCEHFCNWCISGLSRSPQVKRTVVWPPLALCLVVGLSACAFQLVAG